MGLNIPQNKLEARKNKSFLAVLDKLHQEGQIDSEVFNHFVEKLKESGELNLAMQIVSEKDKHVKHKLRHTKEYQEKIEISKQRKFIKAKKERNLDETRGALELILKQCGNSLTHDERKLLSI